MNKNLLSIHNLSACYVDQVYSLDHIDFAIKPGEIVAVVGGSGSGKSTLLKCIIGMYLDGDFEISGEMQFREKNLLSLNEKEWNQIRGEEIAMIFQNTSISLNPNRRIYKQVYEYALEHGKKDKKEIKTKMLRFLQAVQLSDPERVMNSYPYELSGGMMQRVSIAMSMLLNPSLILADEPTSALDVTVQAQVVSQIKEMRNQLGSAIIFVTHNMGVASYVADRIVVMQNGKIIESGTRDQIIFHPQEEYTRKLLAAVPDLEDV